MAGYLSDEWFDSVSAAAEPPGSERSPGEDPDVVATLVLQHVVTDAPQGEVRYYVRVLDGAVAVVRGQAPEPDVTFAENYTTAAAIASGELTAAAALLAGRIRVGGDMAALIARRDLLDVDDPLADGIRATTTYR